MSEQIIMEKDNSVMFVEVNDGTVEATEPPVKQESEEAAVAAAEAPKKAKPTTSKSGTYQEKRIRCPECRYYTAENEEKMTRHIRKMHRGENPFQCYMCDYTTYNKVCFEEHVRVHQGIKPYKCSFCPHRTVSKKNMKKHELIHRPDNPLKCQQCDYIARHKRALEFHLRGFHTGDIEPEQKDSSDVSCKRCGLKFEDEKGLKSHNKSMRKCKLCDYVGCSSTATKQHMVKKHGVVNGKKMVSMFVCAVCQWSCSHVARVLLHLIHHPDQTVDETVFDLTILRKHGIVK